MNNGKDPYSRRKSYQYLYRTVGNMYNEGEEYVDKRAKLIVFNNYKNEQKLELEVSNFKLMDKENDLVIEDIEIFEIYLPNFKKTCYHNVNKEDISLSLFTCKSYEEMRKRTNNRKDIEIIEELEELAMNGAVIFDYHRENDEKIEKSSIRQDGYLEGMNRGISQGITQGISQRNIEIAKSLLSTNMPLEQVSHHTCLSVEDIKKIKQNM